MTEMPSGHVPASASIPSHESGFIRWLIAGIGFVLIGMWAVIGFLLWIPLVGRMIFLFFSAVVSTMFTGRDPTQARISLDYAVTFYARGFELIRSSMRGTLEHHSPITLPEGEHLWFVLRQVLYAVLFWIGIILFWKALTHGVLGWLLG